jgi:phosphate transport system permease protein
MILAISRAVGETMVVALAAGATAGPFTLNRSARPTSTGAMASPPLAATRSQATRPLPEPLLPGLLLFLMTLGLNILGDALVRRTRQTY